MACRRRVLLPTEAVVQRVALDVPVNDDLIVQLDKPLGGQVVHAGQSDRCRRRCDRRGQRVPRGRDLPVVALHQNLNRARGGQLVGDGGVGADADPGDV